MPPNRGALQSGCAADVSVVARDRPALRRAALAKVERHFIHIAPAPALRRVIALDDRVARGVEVGGGVPVRRVIAATDVAAGPAEPQMQPDRADLQALLTAQ